MSPYREYVSTYKVLICMCYRMYGHSVDIISISISTIQYGIDASKAFTEASLPLKNSEQTK
jgi:hypothetical protein